LKKLTSNHWILELVTGTTEAVESSLSAGTVVLSAATGVVCNSDIFGALSELTYYLARLSILFLDSSFNLLTYIAPTMYNCCN
jgi:hypothetical protein